MTYPEFLEALRNTPRDWTLWNVMGKGGGVIRRVALFERQCPITSLSQCWISLGEFHVAAHQLGIEYSLARTICTAADDLAISAEEIQVRRDLLEACGLKESL